MLRDYYTQNVFIGLIVFCLLLVVLASQLFSARFIDFVSVIWNDRYSKLYIRERKKLDIFNGILFLNLIISCGLFLIICYKIFLQDIENENLALIFLISGLFLMLILKITLERLVAHAFEITEMVKNYLFRKATYKNVSGLVLLAGNVLLLFSTLDKKMVIFSIITLIFLINVIGFIRFFKDYQKVLIINLFYFLLYLCALEIGPYVILYKVIKDYFA
ncbi:DUF4271 domain-containing protein [Winogradskyella litorisediminis]|uniref:DUF4271 domain-containing protein n=1 Tax=Winogradskyella litorisediminis TaxID=1156618 RepID=A0ABW3N6H1_9FLAO